MTLNPLVLSLCGIRFQIHQASNILPLLSFCLPESCEWGLKRSKMGNKEEGVVLRLWTSIVCWNGDWGYNLLAHC